MASYSKIWAVISIVIAVIEAREPKFIINSRGTRLMMYKGFYYTVHMKRKLNAGVTKFRWFCRGRSNRCKSNIHTLNDEIVSVKENHNHEPEYKHRGSHPHSMEGLEPLMCIQCPSPIQEEVVETIPDTEASWMTHELVVEAPSANQLQEINPIMPGAEIPMMASLIVDANEVPSAIQQEDQTMPVTETSWMAHDIVEELSSANPLENVVHVMPIIEPSWITQSVMETNVIPSSNLAEEINSTITVPQASWMAQEILETNDTPSSNQLEQNTPIISVPEASWMPQEIVETNDTPSSNQLEKIDPNILVLNASWMVHETPSSNQSQEMNQTMLLVPDASWMSHEVAVVNEAPSSKQSQEINQTMPIPQASWIAQIVAPSANETEGTNQIMPVAEGSSVGQTMIDPNQAGVQWGIIALMYPTLDDLNQSQERDSAMPAADTMVVGSQENWEVHPYIQASLNSLNDPQTSGEQLPEYSNDNPEPLAIDEDVQPEYQEDNSTIAIPLITDPNVTPELVTFRPGVYEGDSIPPVYSDFSIIAATSDYEPPVPSPVYPNLSIIPEPVPENQIITETVTLQDAEIIIDEEELPEYMTSAQPITEEAIKKRPPAIEKIVEQELSTAISGPSTNAGYRGVDPKLLATLRHIKLILIYKGYHFSRYYCQNLKIRWHCVSQRCEAYLYSVGNKITVAYPVHNHLSITSPAPTCVQSPKPNADCLSLEEAISAMTDSVSPFNDDTEPNTSSAADKDTMTSSYDRVTPLNSPEAYNPAQIAKCGNPFDSNVTHLVLASGNTIIPHDPSLEITVKTSSVSSNNANIDVDTSITTTLTRVPDPLGICVTTYNPPKPQNELEPQNEPDLSVSNCSGPIPHPNYNYMTVPEDVHVKVTITSEPLISKPRVYYDGKLAPEPISPPLVPTCRATPTSVGANIPTTTNKSTSFNASNASSVTSVPTFTLHQVSPPIKSNNVQTVAIIASNAASTGVPIPRLIRKPNILSLRRDHLTSNATTVSTNKTITRGTSNACNQTSTNVSTDTNVLPTRATPSLSALSGIKPVRSGRPFINIPRSQIVSSSHSQYSDLYNTFIPRVQTQATNQQSSHEEPSDAQDIISNFRSATSRLFSRNFRNPSVSDNVSSASNQPGSHRISTIPISRFPGLSLPRRTMIPSGYTQRRSIRLARARNIQSTPRHSNE